MKRISPNLQLQKQHAYFIRLKLWYTGYRTLDGKNLAPSHLHPMNSESNILKTEHVLR